MNRKKVKNGFTLLELLVVIAIMGVLTTIVLASLNAARGKARDAQRIAEIEQIKKALELYLHDYGEYPEQGVAHDFVAIPDFTTLSGYFGEFPTDPHASGSNSGYLYRRNALGRYTIRVEHYEGNSDGRCRTFSPGYSSPYGSGSWHTDLHCGF